MEDKCVPLIPRGARKYTQKNDLYSVPSSTTKTITMATFAKKIAL